MTEQTTKLCICGYPEGELPNDCERCQLIAEREFRGRMINYLRALCSAFSLQPAAREIPDWVPSAIRVPKEIRQTFPKLTLAPGDYPCKTNLMGGISVVIDTQQCLFVLVGLHDCEILAFRPNGKKKIREAELATGG